MPQLQLVILVLHQVMLELIQKSRSSTFSHYHSFFPKYESVELKRDGDTKKRKALTANSVASFQPGLQRTAHESSHQIKG